MRETTYYQRNRETVLNRANDYIKNNKKKLRKKVMNKYRKIFQEEKNVKREYGRNIYIYIYIISEEKNQRLKEYQKHYHEANQSKESEYNVFIK